jgi:hypothetical protein
MGTLNIILFATPFGGIIFVLLLAALIFFSILSASGKIKEEKESFSNPKKLTLDNAGLHYQVVAVDGEKIQLKMLGIGGSNELPLSEKKIEEICVYLTEIDSGPDYWFENSNIEASLRQYGKIFRVINDGGKLGFYPYN